MDPWSRQLIDLASYGPSLHVSAPADARSRRAARRCCQSRWPASAVHWRHRRRLVSPSVTPVVSAAGQNTSCLLDDSLSIVKPAGCWCVQSWFAVVRRLVPTRRRWTGATLRNRDHGATGPARCSAACHLPRRPSDPDHERRAAYRPVRRTDPGGATRSSSLQSCVDRTASCILRCQKRENFWHDRVDADSQNPRQL